MVLFQVLFNSVVDETGFYLFQIILTSIFHFSGNFMILSALCVDEVSIPRREVTDRGTVLQTVRAAVDFEGLKCV